MPALKSLLSLAWASTAMALMAPRQEIKGTATVKLAEPSGTPQHWASGFIYGFPSNKDGSASEAIPADLVEGMGFNFCRAGGAQMQDALGWVSGQYEGRFASALSNYRTTRHYGGRFTLLMHDLWGADSRQGEGFKWPGDDGDWTYYDEFLDTVFADLKNNNALEGLDIDIWNEPDITAFWNAPREQYLATWNHTYHRIREELPNTIITGPSSADASDRRSGWWNDFVMFVAETKTVPDQWSWHLIGSGINVRQSRAELDHFVQQHNLPPIKEANINEYGKAEGEQNAAGAAYFIGQFDRAEVPGLRSNWASFEQLQDLMSNLLVKQQDGTYLPTGEWFVYNYFVKTMIGERVATNPSSDELFEVYATRDGKSAKILAGLRPNGPQGRYYITVTGLSDLGEPVNDKLAIRTLRFDGRDAYTAGSNPTDLGIYEHDVIDNSVNFWVQPEDITSGYAFEFELL